MVLVCSPQSAKADFVPFQPAVLTAGGLPAGADLNADPHQPTAMLGSRCPSECPPPPRTPHTKKEPTGGLPGPPIGSRGGALSGTTARLQREPCCCWRRRQRGRRESAASPA